MEILTNNKRELTFNTPQVQTLSLVLLIILAYIPALKAGFLWDNTGIVENVFLRTGSGLWKIWMTPWVTEEPHYWPLVYTVFWIEYHLWGLAPFGYHLVNILLHALNTILLWKILQRISIPGAWLAAAIFGLHPVHVESVAWLIELKDVLSGLFYLLAFLTFLNFDETLNWQWYLLTMVCYACSLLSKTVTVTFPMAILLYYWYKNENFNRRQFFLILPLFAVGILLTLWDIHLIQQQAPFKTNLLWIDRYLLAGHAIWFYISKLFYPLNLMTFYPMWRVEPHDILLYLYPLSVGILLLVLWLQRKRIGKGPLTAVLYFLITLSPMLGFIDFEYMIYSLVADRFQYLASIGVIVLFTAFVVCFTDKLVTPIRVIGSSIILLILGILTWHQSTYYYNSETLFNYNLAKNPKAWEAWLTLGLIATNEGKLAEGEKDFRKVLEIRPDNLDALNDLAYTSSKQGKLNEALNYLNDIIRINPSNAYTYNNIGVIQVQQSKTEAAIANFSKAIEIRPDYVKARSNLGRCLMKEGKYEEAMSQFSTVLRLDPGDTESRENLELLKNRSADTAK